MGEGGVQSRVKGEELVVYQDIHMGNLLDPFIVRSKTDLLVLICVNSA